LVNDVYKMKKILFATTNKNKVKRMKNFLGKIPYEIISLTDINQEIKEPPELGVDGVEIAKLKAYYYFSVLNEKIPVVTQDDTLNLYDIPESEIVRNSIKKPVVDAFGDFNDKSALRFYTQIANKYGGEVKMSFEYGHGFCDGNVLKASPSTLQGKLVSVPSKIFEPGYFLTAIVKVGVGDEWKYISELSNEEYAIADKDLKKSVKYLFSL
jgi:hypothetical protein